MIREIYMVSILQLQKKKKVLICLEIGNRSTCFLYFMLCFAAHWNELAAMNEKKLLHLISSMNFDWKLLCRTSMKSLGPVPSLCLWMKRHEPHALLPRVSSTPRPGPSPFPLRRRLGNQLFARETNMTQKGIQCDQCARLRDLSCAFHPAAFTPVF